MKLIAKTTGFISKQITDIKKYGLVELLRKFHILGGILIDIPLIIFAIVPCVIIRLISPWIIIRIERFPCENFGDFIEFPSCYHLKKKFKINLPKKKYLDLVYIYHRIKIFNKQLAKMWKRKFNFLPSYLLDPIRKVNKLIPGWKAHSIEVLIIKSSRDVDNIIEKYQPLEFTKEEEVYGKKMLEKIGIKNGDKFVCLVVRDGGYQQKKIPSRYRDWSYQNYRNQDINNYMLASEELAKRGYYVFRMGVNVEKKFISNNPKVIDYANSNFRSSFMDVYLGTKCFFCISTGTGFDYLAYFSRRPIAHSSYAPIGHFHTYTKKNMHLPQHHILKKEKRKLSLSEIFANGLGFAIHSKDYEEKGVEVVQNTPEEIKDLVLEMLEYLEFNKKLDPIDEELQKSFRKLYVINLKRFYRVDENYIIHSEILSRMSSKFLRENKYWLQ